MVHMVLSRMKLADDKNTHHQYSLSPAAENTINVYTSISIQHKYSAISLDWQLFKDTVFASLEYSPIDS